MSIFPLSGSKPKRKPGETRPRTAGLEVGNLEVVGPEHGWERGAGSRPGPWACHKMEAKGRKWRLGEKGERSGRFYFLSKGSEILRSKRELCFSLPVKI